MRSWLRTARGRAAAAGALLVLVGVGASLAAGDLGADRDGRRHRSPEELAGLLPPGVEGIVLDEHGRPRVAADGRTLVDAKGRPLRDKQGRLLVLGPGGEIHAVPDKGDPGRDRTGGRDRGGGRRRGGGRGGGTARGAVVVGIAYADADRLNQIYARYGGYGRASDGGPDSQAVADYINSTGGVGGRPLELRLRKYDTTDGRPYDVTFAEVCTWFGEGARPVAVVTVGSEDELAPCLSSKDIPLINDFPTAGSSAFEARFPSHFFQPGSLALDRYAVPYVRGLEQQGFFRGDARVALLRYSDPDLDAVVERHLRPALAAAGVRLEAEEAIPVTRSVDDISGLLTKVGTAVVRFRANGVNRIISVDNRGDIVGLFAQAAEPQGYRPRYGLSSLNAPFFLRASLPPNQFRGAVGIGWSPITDVAAAQEGEVPATRALCAEIFSRAGVQLGNRTAYGQYGAYSRCSNLLMLRAALERADASTSAGLRDAIEALGSRFQSAVTMRTELSRSRHDGATSYRPLHFDDGCDCFRYDGDLHGAD